MQKNNNNMAELSVEHRTSDVQSLSATGLRLVSRCKAGKGVTFLREKILRFT